MTDLRPSLSMHLGRRALACSLLLASMAAQATPSYSVFDLDRIAPGGQMPYFYGMNNSGQLVGSLTPDGSPYYNTGVIFTLDTATAKDFAVLPMLLPYQTSPTIEFPNPVAINDRGQITGEIRIHKDEGERRSFYYSAADGMRSLGNLIPNIDVTVARDINAAGQIVGSGLGDHDRAVTYDLSTGLRQLALPSFVESSSAEALNDHGVIVGNFNLAGESGNATFHARGYVFDGQHFTELGSLGGRLSLADINNRGTIAGTSSLQPGGGEHAVLYTNGSAQPLDLHTTQHSGNNFGSSRTVGINDHNQVVGTASSAGHSGQTTFYYDEQLGMVDLNSLLDPAVPAGWEITEVQDINDWGQILARATLPDGSTHAVLLSDLTAPVPDLSAGTSLLFGLLLLGARTADARRRKPKIRPGDGMPARPPA